ncbi:MAG: HD domain-containing protein [Candidatus Saccharibacteria bacterium]|nr:HD domain-containing protein [Candidatus Saccharibacteria bacterium]
MTNTKNYHKITNDERFQKSKDFVQHGDFSVYDHSVYVCETCFKMSKVLHLKVDSESLAKGALLHDYFLYDWHDKNHPRFHGFRHAGLAAENAKRDFGLNSKEEKMIRAHMFPLGLKAPSSKEAILLCIADKYCATVEAVSGRTKKIKNVFKHKK